MNRKTGILAAGVALLAVIAVIGWSRRPSANVPQASYYDQNGQPVYGAPPPVSVNQSSLPAANDVNSPGYQQALYSAPYQNDRYVSDRYIRSIHRPVRVINRQDYVSRQDNAGRQDFAGRQDVVGRQEDYAGRQNYVEPGSSAVYQGREPVRRRDGRSKEKSVAIVAGSAAGGAAIGAIAGGGKGAGLGALAGGGAGFIYDRLTHNHR